MPDPTPPVAPPAPETPAPEVPEPAAPIVPPAAAPVIPPTEVPTDDPLHIEYAESLKLQLGTYYDKEMDALPLAVRIKQMKIIKKTIDKIPTRSEGTPPVTPPVPAVNKVKNHVEAWKAGNTAPKANKAIGMKLFKNEM